MLARKKSFESRRLAVGCLQSLCASLILCFVYIAGSFLTSSLLLREKPNWAAFPVLASGVLCVIYSFLYDRTYGSVCLSNVVAVFKVVTFSVCFCGVFISAIGAYYTGYRAVDIGSYFECIDCPQYSTRCPHERWSFYAPHVINCLCLLQADSQQTASKNVSTSPKFKIGAFYDDLTVSRFYGGCDDGIRFVLKYALAVISSFCSLASIACFCFTVYFYRDTFHLWLHDNADSLVRRGRLNGVRYYRVASNSKDLQLRESSFPGNLQFEGNSSHLQRFEFPVPSLDSSSNIGPSAAWNEDKQRVDESAATVSSFEAKAALEVDTSAVLRSSLTSDVVTIHPLAEPNAAANEDEKRRASAMAAHASRAHAARKRSSPLPLLIPAAVVGGSNVVHPSGGNNGDCGRLASFGTKATAGFHCGQIYEEPDLARISVGRSAASHNKSSNQGDLDDLLFTTAELLVRSDVFGHSVNVNGGPPAMASGCAGKGTGSAKECFRGGGSTASKLIVDEKEFWV